MVNAVTQDASCAVDSTSDPRLTEIAKTIGDLDDLVRLLIRALPRAKTWQRQLVSFLGDVDRTIQVLRVAVSMGRPDPEIVEAAAEVQDACRRTDLALVGTRADQTAKASVRLALDLSQRLPRLLTAEISPRAAWAHRSPASEI